MFDSCVGVVSSAKQHVTTVTTAAHYFSIYY